MLSYTCRQNLPSISLQLKMYLSNVEHTARPWNKHQVNKIISIINHKYYFIKVKYLQNKRNSQKLDLKWNIIGKIVDRHLNFTFYNYVIKPVYKGH